MIYIHKKTGRRYRWLAMAVNCTNGDERTLMAVYCPDDDEHTIYVREESEFFEKFEPYLGSKIRSGE